MKLRRRPSSLPSLFLSQSIEIVNALDFGAKIVTFQYPTFLEIFKYFEKIF